MNLHQSIEKLRKSETGRLLIPLGVGIGLPVPYISLERFYVIIPLLEKMRSQIIQVDDKIPVRKPVGEIRFDVANGQLVKFQLYRCDDPIPEIPWDKPYSWFPPSIVIDKKWSRLQYQSKCSELFRRIDDLFQVWNESKQINNELINQYQVILGLLIDPNMYSYYQRVIQSNIIGSDGLRICESKNADVPLTPFD